MKRLPRGAGVRSLLSSILTLASLAAVSSKLRVEISGWDTDIGNLKDWYREA